MGSVRRFISSRPIVGLGVVLAVGLVSLWSYSFSVLNKTLSFSLGFPIVSIAIFWSIYEIVRLKEKSKLVWIYVSIGYLLSIVPFIYLFLNENKRGEGIILSFLVTTLVWLWSRFFRREEFFKDTSFSSLLIGSTLFWHILLFLVLYSLWYWLLLIFGLGMLNDSLAFVSGRVFGKRELSIYSPNKTKEGFWIGCACTYLISISFFYFVPLEVRELFLGEKRMWYLVFVMVLLGLLILNFGDLYFSMHKRVFGIKDFSRVLGNHGGFWDRFDSHSFTLIYFGLCCLMWETLVV